MTKRKSLIIQLLSAELKKCTGRDWLVHYEKDDIIVSTYYQDCGTYRTTYCNALNSIIVNALNSIIVNENYIKMLSYTILADLYTHKLICQLSKKDVDNTTDLW